ncbi:MAG: hypothetical protein R3F43_27490 [bacterium]
MLASTGAGAAAGWATRGDGLDGGGPDAPDLADADPYRGLTMEAAPNFYARSSTSRFGVAARVVGGGLPCSTP